MKVNEKLLEKPDHGHYAACAERKTGIEEFSRNVFFYTVAASIIFTVMTYCGADIAAVSWIPSLFGPSTEVPHLFSQTFELILFVLMSALGYGKRKIFHLIIFALYIVITLASIFDGNLPADLLTFIIGAVGTALTFPSIRVYSDYNHLRSVEGWPHFSITYTESVEHPTYTSRYMSEYRAAPADRVSAPESSRPAPDMPEMTGISAPEPEMFMEDMPVLDSISSAEPAAPDEALFVPDSGMTDGPFDIQ